MKRSLISRFSSFVAVALILLASAPALAQEPDLSEVQTSGMETFFRWFRAAFDPLLPIVLVGVGLLAGGLFVWIVARAFIGAIQRLRGAKEEELADLEDPLAGWDDETLKEAGLNPDQIAGYRQRLGLLQQWDRDAPDESRRLGLGPDGKRYRRLTKWEIDFLLLKDKKYKKGEDKSDDQLLSAFTRKQRELNFMTIEIIDKKKERQKKAADISPQAITKKDRRTRRTDDFVLFDFDGGSKRKRGRTQPDTFDFGMQTGRRQKQDAPFFGAGSGYFGGDLGGSSRRGSGIDLSPTGGFDLFGSQRAAPRRRRRR